MSSKITYSPKLNTVQLEADLSCIRRVLVAASIHAGFCRLLLMDPCQAVSAGFGGERFDLSEANLVILSTIQAETLAEFIQTLNEKITLFSA